MTSRIRQQFEVPFAYDVVFTRDVFSPDSTVLRDAMRLRGDGAPARALFVIDEGVADAHPIEEMIRTYAAAHNDRLDLAGEPLILPGGEPAKNNPQILDRILCDIEARRVCRHSYVIAVGGGAILDVAGYAAAIAHRGVRHVRIPTTTLAQGDSAVGVKNGVNAFGKKNFLGTFAPPIAVLNDAHFLTTLDDRDWRGGVSEAIKVALLKDCEFFEWIERSAVALNTRDLASMEQLVRRSAELHLQHIATGGDPFELGSSRPLDFGHWAAHKLEQLSNFELRHGDAVAIGLALDLTYSKLAGFLDDSTHERAMHCLESCGFELWSPHLLEDESLAPSVARGLDEFREHLGGELTIMLLRALGDGFETNTMDVAVIEQSARELAARAAKEELKP